MAEPNTPRCTEEEAEQRVATTKRLIILALEQGMYRKSDVKNLLVKQHGIGARQAQDYISRAWEEIRVELALNLDEERTASVEWLKKIIADTSQKLGLRLMARRHLDKILGLHILKIEHSGSVGMAGIDLLRQELLRQPGLFDDAEPQVDGGSTAPVADSSEVRPVCNETPPRAVDSGTAPRSDRPGDHQGDSGRRNSADAADSAD